MTKRFILAAIAIAVLIGASYWFATGAGRDHGANIPTQYNDSTTPSDTSAEEAAASSGKTLSVVTHETRGTYLVASNGMTVYTYANDEQGESTCNGDCAKAWPPYIVSVEQQLAAGDGVSGQIATISRSDGSAQVTYDGAPLYFFSHDETVGDANGQGIGGVWYVVQPESL